MFVVWGLFVCLFAGLCENYWMGFRCLWEDEDWADEEPVGSCWVLLGLGLDEDMDSSPRGVNLNPLTFPRSCFVTVL